MVTVPKCKICGAAHWLSEPHQLSEKAVEHFFGGLALKSGKLIYQRPALDPELVRELGDHGPKARDGIAFNSVSHPQVAPRKKGSPRIKESSLEGGTLTVADDGVMTINFPKRDRAAYMREYRRSK